jgi:hypothetical protein
MFQWEAVWPRKSVSWHVFSICDLDLLTLEHSLWSWKCHQWRQLRYPKGHQNSSSHG